MYKFEPLLKQTLWGGDKIIPFKHLGTQMEHVGESWEISGVNGSETIVATGQDKGKSLNQLVAFKYILTTRQLIAWASLVERLRCGMYWNQNQGPCSTMA